MARRHNYSPNLTFSHYSFARGEPAPWFEQAVMQVRKPGQKERFYPFKQAELINRGYAGAELREMRARNGVGRPPKVAKAKRIAAWERGA